MSTEYSDNFIVKDFQIGDNIELHPATDAWMQGDRFGMVSKIGRKYIHVLMDRSDRTLQMLPKDVGKWNGPGRSKISDEVITAASFGATVPATIEEESEHIEELIDKAYEIQQHRKFIKAMDESDKTLAVAPNDDPVAYQNIEATPAFMAKVINKPRPEPEPAQIFQIGKKTFSTRSSDPKLRKLAKKLARKGVK